MNSKEHPIRDRVRRKLLAPSCGSSRTVERLGYHRSARTPEAPTGRKRAYLVSEGARSITRGTSPRGCTQMARSPTAASHQATPSYGDYDKAASALRQAATPKPRPTCGSVAAVRDSSTLWPRRLVRRQPMTTHVTQRSRISSSPTRSPRTATRLYGCNEEFKIWCR